MSMTLVVGLGVVLVSAAAVIPMLFSARPEPATLGTTASGSAAGAPQPAAVANGPGPGGIFEARPRRPQLQTAAGSDHVNLRWWERVRGVGGLLLLVVGLGLSLAAIVGSAVFILSLTVLGSK